MLVRLDLSDVDYHGNVCPKPGYDARARGQYWQVFERHLIQIGDRFFYGSDVLVVDQPMQEVIMELRDYRRRNVRWSLARNGQENTKLPTLFNYFFECFEAVVLPMLTFSFGAFP